MCHYLMHAGFESWPKSHKYKKYSKNLHLDPLGMVRGVVFTCILGPNIIPIRLLFLGKH